MTWLQLVTLAWIVTANWYGICAIAWHAERTGRLTWRVDEEEDGA